jgi:hypothetical protein
MSSNLKLDWCSHEAAKYAVMHWHYSKAMPAGKLIKIGVWENEVFIGAVIFSRGANNHIGSPYGLNQVQICELTRVALDTHKSAVTKVVSIAIMLLKKSNTGLRLIVSYADPEQNHMGIIYQAGNWVYCGETQRQAEVLLNGKIVHRKTIFSKYGTTVGFPKSKILFKYKYLYPLDDDMKRQIEPLKKPYPKRAQSIEVMRPANQPEEGGSTPTCALHDKPI